MKIPHHLQRAPSGVWHFRRRVPADLVEPLRRTFLKHSLRTRVLSMAQVRAFVLSAQYEHAFARLRASMAGRDPNDPAEIRFDYTLKLDGVEIIAKDEQDHARALEALQALREAMPRQSADHGRSEVPGSRGSSKPTIGVQEGVRKWLLTLKEAKPKTVKQKRAAAESFAFRLGSTPLGNVTRTDVSEWLECLRTSGLTTRTLYNKASFLSGFFAWAMGAGYFPRGDNPAAGQVKYGKNEKRVRKHHGYQAFSAEEIQDLYSPEAIVLLSPAARWAALLGLYTGARVSEVGQLRLSDFGAEDGIACIRITDEGVGQSVKTAASVRTVPLHPTLLALGLLEYVESMRAAGADRLFPGLMVGSVNGPGSAFSSAFSRHLKKCGVKAKGSHKVGFHSLRKTAIQVMQSGRVPSEFRAQYVGHELEDEHHGTYSRTYTPRELASVVHPALSFRLDLPRLRDALSARSVRRRHRAG